MESSQRTNTKQRHQRIAEAAYFRAEKRGFEGGDPVADWVDAEQEIDAEQKRAEHRRLIEDLEERLATAGNKLKSLKRKVASRTAAARAELEEDIQRLAQLRESLAKRLDEVREQGLQAGHRAWQQAEKLWLEIAEIAARYSARRRAK